jgi:hypothetical protein
MDGLWHPLVESTGLEGIELADAGALVYKVVSLKIAVDDYRQTIIVENLSWVPGKPPNSGHFTGIEESSGMEVTFRLANGQWLLCWPATVHYLGKNYKMPKSPQVTAPPASKEYRRCVLAVYLLALIDFAASVVFSGPTLGFALLVALGVLVALIGGLLWVTYGEQHEEMSLRECKLITGRGVMFAALGWVLLLVLG